MLDDELSLDDFLAALLGADRSFAWQERADAMLAAVTEIAHGRPLTDPEASRTGMAVIVRAALDGLCAPMNPFASFLEAPQSIIELYGRHGDAVGELSARRTEVLTALLRDAATALFEQCRPVSWKDLLDRGVSPTPPPVPDIEDW